MSLNEVEKTSRLSMNYYFAEAIIFELGKTKTLHRLVKAKNELAAYEQAFSFFYKMQKKYCKLKSVVVYETIYDSSGFE